MQYVGAVCRYMYVHIMLGLSISGTLGQERTLLIIEVFSFQVSVIQGSGLEGCLLFRGLD